MISVRPRAPSSAFLLLLLAVAASGVATPSWAQGRPPIVAKVDALQAPAWVVRGGVKAGIKAGWAIFAGDRVLTGDDGRLQLSVAGGGVLKLGGGAHIAFPPVSQTGADTSLFDVRNGTFHFAAPMVSRPNDPGTLIGLKGGGVGANVRGGQIFGTEDSLCLLEGLVLIGAGQKTVTMNKPNTVANVSPSGKVLSPVPVAPERLAQWASAVRPLSGRPALVAEGSWDVSLNSGYNLKELETMACRIQRLGWPAEIYPVREPGKQVWYRVVVRRFGSKAEAVGFLPKAKELGAREPWVLLPQT